MTSSYLQRQYTRMEDRMRRKTCDPPWLSLEYQSNGSDAEILILYRTAVVSRGVGTVSAVNEGIRQAAEEDR